MKIVAKTPVYPTENEEAVKQAILNIFPESKLTYGENELIATTDSGERLKEILRNHRIRDTARHILRAGREGDKTRFRINKQVACVSKVSFVEGSPALGSIDVEIEAEDIDAAIDDLAPSTLEVREE